MFEEILNSKKLSQATFSFICLPARAYSINEASKMLRMPLGSASHILNRLQINNLLKSVSKHGKKYFFYKPSVDVPPWIKNKLSKFKRKQEDGLIEDIKKLSPKAVVLSGIFCGYANLPVDILLVGRYDLKKVQRFLEKWQGIMSLELNYSIMSESEFIDRRDTFDKFIKDIFDHRHLVIVDKLGKK